MDEPLKIFHIITRLNIGGAAVCNLLLAEEQFKHGHDVTLITGVAEKAEGEMLELLKGNEYSFKIISIPELRKPLLPLKDIISFFKIWNLIRKHQPDVVHTHLSKAGLLGRLAAFFCRVPVVIHSNHGAIFRGYYGSAFSSAIVAAERALSWICDRVFVATKATREDILSVGAAKESKIEVIPLGIDLKPFTDLSDQKGVLRERFNLKAKRLVGVAARLTPVKAIDDFIIAAKEVCNSVDDVDFVIAGDGELRSSLEKLAQSLGIKHRVHFIGFLAEMRAFYEAIDVFVVTSVSEGTCISVLEAISSRKSVVATRVGGIPDAVEDGVNGLLFTPHDIAGLTSRLLKVLHHPEIVRSNDDITFLNTISRYSVESRTAQMEKVYRQVLKEKQLLKNSSWAHRIANTVRRITPETF